MAKRSDLSKNLGRGFAIDIGQAVIPAGMLKRQRGWPVVKPMRSLRVSSGKSLEPRILRLRAECFAADDEVHVDHSHECQREAGVLVQAHEPFLSVRAEDREHAQHHRQADRHDQKYRQPEGQFPAQVRRVSRGCFFQAQQVGQAATVVLVQAALVSPRDGDHPGTNDEHRGKANVQHEGVAVDLLPK